MSKEFSFSVSFTNANDLEQFLSDLDDFTEIKWVSGRAPTEPRHDIHHAVRRCNERGRIYIIIVRGTAVGSTIAYSKDQPLDDNMYEDKPIIPYHRGVINMKELYE